MNPKFSPRLKAVRIDVEPKECFIRYPRHDYWEPIPGTGCARWVAHEKQIQSGRSDEKCLFGYTFRVHVLADTCSEVPLENVRSGDIWISDEEDHAGLVIRVMPNLYPDEIPEITICHDSSRQNGVAINDFKTYFHGRGWFCR
ncbi:hypothetical protein [Candidatus Binatus sp.]|uniref:hypothetical protein n=1 Tax=Candidatus Binatus sp. TaxID=2811406 RepID=UPI003C85A8F0